LALKLNEGKKPMSREVYSFLAQKLFESERKEHIFAHLFLVLDWNLMKRAENCVDLKLEHVKMEGDSMVFEFAKSKGAQGGEEHVGPWHVYANPLEPSKCPVLAFARYLFTFPDCIKTNASVFAGKSQYERYSKLFQGIIKKYESELKELGVGPGDLGTHSCRKGVATMVAGGCTVSPPIISLCIRAGWKMGGVKEKYLKYEAAGDQYVGRCAAGLNQLTKEFAVSPPHFDFTEAGEDDLDHVIARRKITTWLKTRITNLRRVSPHTQHLIFNVFASVCFHYDYLSTNISPNCAF
jgi:phage-related protein